MKNLFNFYKIIKGQYSTEKSVMLSDRFNVVTFIVSKNSNKYHIKNAIKNLFNISVLSVKIINISGKTVKFKNIIGKKKNWKKAMVFLKKGDNINFSEFK